MSEPAVTVSDLAGWLLERLDEEHAVATAATQGRWLWEEPSAESFPQGDRSLVADQGVWEVCQYHCTWTSGSNVHRGESGKPGHEHRKTLTVVSGWGYDASGLDVEDADAAHITRHAPTRVLADVAAKRAIIARHQETAPPYADSRQQEIHETLRDEVLPFLTLPYAGHDGYRSEWAP